MERGGGQEDVERRRRHRPALEVRVDHRDRRKVGQIASRAVGEVGAKLDRDHLVAAHGEWSRGLAGSRPELEHAAAGAQLTEGGQRLENRHRIARSGPVVQLGRVVELGAQVLALLRPRDQAGADWGKG